MADGSAGRVRTWNVWGDSAPNGEIDSTDWLHTLRPADADSAVKCRSAAWPITTMRSALMKGSPDDRHEDPHRP
jgi:hypothetical protein